MAIIELMGPVMGSTRAYDELFDAVVTASRERDGQTSAARLLLHRGADQLQAKKNYHAITTLGQALTDLFKHESRVDLVRALGLIAAAYESVGLLWAARGTLLSAASVATSDYWTYSDVTVLQAKCYSRIKWIEIQLGRIPQALAWHQIDVMVRRVLVDAGYDPTEVNQHQMDFDVILGMLYLRADLVTLKEHTKSSDILERLGLFSAAVALRFAMGHQDQLPAEIKSGESEAEPTKFFEKWNTQPAGESLPERLPSSDTMYVEQCSQILGCRITAKCRNVSPCIELGESLLAAFESLLATAGLTQVVAREPTVRIEIETGDFVSFPFTHEITEPSGRPLVQIRCASFSPHQLTAEQRHTLTDRLLELLVSLLARCFLMADVKHVAKRLFRDERATERAINFTSSFVTIGNVLGPAPVHTVAQWTLEQDRDFPILRREEWDSAARVRLAKEKSESGRPLIFNQAPPADEFDPTSIKHTDIQMDSLIRESLWNQAHWSGAAYLTVPTDENRPPLLALIFDDRKAGSEIFADWQRELGQRDRAERLRLTVVRGIDRKQPLHYRMAITTNLAPAPLASQPSYFVKTVRSRVMEATTHANLDRFVTAYQLRGAYWLTYGIATGGEPDIRVESAILKTTFTVRDAWQIGRNDEDAMGIHFEDDPVIPPGVATAPVTELLAWIREAERRR